MWSASSDFPPSLGIGVPPTRAEKISSRLGEYYIIRRRAVGSPAAAQALLVRAAAAACGCLHKMPRLFPGMPSSSEAQEAPLIWAASSGGHFLA